MAHIKVKQGLDIPIKGKPTGDDVQSVATPAQVSLNLNVFEYTKFKLLVKPGDVVKVGQPLADDKSRRGRFFVSPGSGVVKEVRRGLKRRLLDVVIDLDKEESHHELKAVNPDTASREELLNLLLEGGAFAHIRQRPFNTLANPDKTPRCIFVKAIESEPFACPAELQVRGYEEEFQAGLTVLSKMTDGAVHLVHRAGSTCDAFTKAQNVTVHTAEGPHPVANHSVHIHHIDPVQGVEDSVWTVRVVDVITIGKLALKGQYHNERVIAMAGTGLHEDRRGFFKVRAGHPIGALVANRTEKGLLRMVSGDVLTGTQVEAEDFLGFKHTSFCVIQENVDREFLHFFMPGASKFTASKTYLSGHMSSANRDYEFTTNMHGEHRGFVDSTIYDKVMPIQVPTMFLVKAVMSNDFETAEELGLLEVDAEDFALPTFVCPCKNEMVQTMKDGLHTYAVDNI